MRDGFDTAALQCPGESKSIHTQPRQWTTIDIDRIHLLGSHYMFYLLENSFDGGALGRVDFHGDDEFLRLNFAPQRAFRFARGERFSLAGSLHAAGRARFWRTTAGYGGDH